ncbi:MAG TPA: hypothetical protein VLF93_03305 [Candidatus Saccharimonadales bacterium]|nr:hypothetical protein [Candidatus Saccharimonadales bacterium]
MVELLTQTAAERRQKLRTWNGKKREELRDTFTDPIAIYAKNVRRFVQEQPEKVNKIAHWNDIEQFSYISQSIPMVSTPSRFSEYTSLLSHQDSGNMSPSNYGFNSSRGFFEQADGRYNHFLMTVTSSPYRQVTPLRAPIGEYGSELAEKMLRTMMFLVEFAGQDRQTHDAFIHKVDTHRNVAERHILRGLDKNSSGPEEGAVASLQEGIPSMFSVLFMHTAEKIKGYENNPDGAVKLVCESDLINATTGISPLAVAFPMQAYGSYFRNPNEFADNNKLVCSTKLIKSLEIMKIKSDQLEYDAWVKYFNGETDGIHPVRLGLVCPVYGDFKNNDRVLTSGGISMITKLIPLVADCITIDSGSQSEHRLAKDIPLFINPQAEYLGDFVQRVGLMRRSGELANSRKVQFIGAPDIFTRSALSDTYRRSEVR